MQRITLNDKRYFIPASWKDVSVKLYVRILKEWDPEIKDAADKNWLKLLNILTGTNFGSLDDTWENQYTITNALSWVVYEPFKFDKQLPKVLQFGKQYIDVPRSSSGLSIGQNIHLRRDYLDKAETIEECISIAAAIFLQPVIDGKKFSMDRAKEIAKEIDDMPVYLIYPIGFFLLKNAGTAGRNFANPWRQILSNLNLNFSKTLQRLRRLAG